MGLRVKFWKKHLQTMGLKVMKQNKITHFSLIKITKMYNDNFLNIFFWVYGWGNEVRGSKATKQLMGRGGGFQKVLEVQWQPSSERQQGNAMRQAMWLGSMMR
jgi:hypothetical protein